jgi:hypothetical protein
MAFVLRHYRDPFVRQDDSKINDQRPAVFNRAAITITPPRLSRWRRSRAA